MSRNEGKSSKTVEAPRLTVELIPKPAWGINVRSKCAQREWDLVRRATYKVAQYRCEICGGRGPTHPVECHERWKWNETGHVQRLIGLIALCPPCHHVKHMGRSLVTDKADLAIKHMMEVNDWARAQVDRHLDEAFVTWRRRNVYDWTVDLSWLHTYLTGLENER